jgi:hypothetical protein
MACGAGFLARVILDFAVETAVFLGCFAGAVLRAGDLLLAAAFLAGTAGLRRAAPPPALFAFGLTCLLLAVGLLDLVALRAGAFSAAERFNIGLGRADLPANERFFDEDPVEV